MSFSLLVIDDDLEFRRLLKRRLLSFLNDCEVVEFGSLSEARKFLKIRARNFNLVVLDQHLPDGSGRELLKEGFFHSQAVLAVSSDDDPQIPGASVQAGAAYFLSKLDVSGPLFKPLVEGLIDRNRIQAELDQARRQGIISETVKTLVGTLRHEINNPLGAVLGAAYLMSSSKNVSAEQKNAAKIVEESGKRIKHVLDQLCEAVSLDAVKKSSEQVFHIPGDKPWDKPSDKE